MVRQIQPRAGSGIPCAVSNEPRAHRPARNGIDTRNFQRTGPGQKSMIDSNTYSNIIRRLVKHKTVYIKKAILNYLRNRLNDDGILISIVAYRGDDHVEIEQIGRRLIIPLPANRTAYLLLPIDLIIEDVRLIQQHLEILKKKLQ
jgi:hypothetical protein